MKRVITVIALLLWAGVLLTSAARLQPSAIEGKSHFTMSASDAALQERKELIFYYDGRRWIPGSFQCDGSREVTIATPLGNSRRMRLVTFQKTEPARKSVLTLRQQGDEDCGMMKCDSTYVGVGSNARYQIHESHYLDDDAYWTRQFSIGKGRRAQDNMEECRWLERAHVAVITEQRSIYVTRTEAGELEYQSFNHRDASEKPSVKVQGGKQELSRGIESFTFTSGDYTYVVNVSTVERRPFVEVLVKRGGATIQKERPLIYTYAKKS